METQPHVQNVQPLVPFVKFLNLMLILLINIFQELKKSFDCSRMMAHSKAIHVRLE